MNELYIFVPFFESYLILGQETVLKLRVKLFEKGDRLPVS